MDNQQSQQHHNQQPYYQNEEILPIDSFSNNNNNQQPQQPQNDGSSNYQSFPATSSSYTEPPYGGFQPYQPQPPPLPPPSTQQHQNESKSTSLNYPPYLSSESGQSINYQNHPQQPLYTDQSKNDLPNTTFMFYDQPPSQSSYHEDPLLIYNNGGIPLLPRDSIDGSWQKFPLRPSCKDIFWLILFILHLAGVMTLFIISSLIRNGSIGSDDIHIDNGGSSTNNTNSIASSDGNNSNYLFPANTNFIYYVIGMCIAISFSIAFLWLFLVRKFPRGVIIATMLFNVLVLIITALITIIYGNFFLGIISLVFAFIFSLAIFSWRNRITFASTILKTVIPVLNVYWGTFITAILALCIQLVWTGFWGFTLFISQDFSKDVNYVSLVLMILSYYWTTQVIKNWVHVTVSGTVASWYFMSGTVGVPRNPTLGAMKRASTTSFGSICFGSLLVAILQTLRQLTYGDRNGDDNIILFCLRIVLSVIERLLQYFNLYAFTQVAVYGKSYWRAAKDTWRLAKTHGIEALINDSLIGGIITCGILIGGVLTALVSGLVTYHFNDIYWIQMAVVGFLIGCSTLYIIMEVLQSAVTTLFVSFAMDPTALLRHSPTLYNKITTSYNQW
eukprot:gene3885-4848_t